MKTTNGTPIITAIIQYRRSCTRRAFRSSSSVGSIRPTKSRPHPFSNRLGPARPKVSLAPAAAPCQLLRPMSKKGPAARRHWLVKSEPETYSWSDFVRERETDWTGVRNHAARNHLSTMKVGDEVLFYESMTTKAVVGTAAVVATATPDPTADEPGWVAVRLKAGAALRRPVTLADVKAEPALAAMTLLRLSRLSVQPVLPAEFALILKLGARSA